MTKTQIAILLSISFFLGLIAAIIHDAQQYGLL